MSTTTSPQAAPRAKQRPGDIVFSRTSLIAGVLILVILAGVAIFLVGQALPAFGASRANGDIPGTAGDNVWEYVGPLAFGTLWVALIALLIAFPFSIGVGLFISHYANRRFAQVLGYVIDLLAAIPSVVFGLWGIAVLAPAVEPFYNWLSTYLGWIPLFAGPVASPATSVLTAAIVLAIMILPIMTAMNREVFLQTPALHEEAALALGATHWEMIKMAVLPFARPGIVSGAMLGLGRALGETMAVAMVLSATPGLISFALLRGQNPNTIAAAIAQNFPEASGTKISVLIFGGLMLFVISIAANLGARWIVNRRKEFSGAN